MSLQKVMDAARLCKTTCNGERNFYHLHSRGCSKALKLRCNCSPESRSLSE